MTVCIKWPRATNANVSKTEKGIIRKKVREYMILGQKYYFNRGI